jgi:hypothetical protein
MFFWIMYRGYHDGAVMLVSTLAKVPPKRERGCFDFRVTQRKGDKEGEDVY